MLTSAPLYVAKLYMFYNRKICQFLFDMFFSSLLLFPCMTLTHLLIFFCFFYLYTPPSSLFHTSSICRCRLLCGSFRAQTGLWVWIVLTCVMVITGKRVWLWSSSHMMQELTAGSPSLLPTLKPSHRTKSHRWVNSKTESIQIQSISESSQKKFSFPPHFMS